VIENRIVELIHGEIDGANSDAQSAELREILASNAEARELHAEMSNLTETLGQAPSVEPPQGLRRSIVDRIGSHDEPVVAVRPRSTTVRAWWPRVAMLAAAILVIVAVWPWLNTTSVTPDDVRGTIAPPVPTPRGAIQIDSPGLSGEVGVEQTAAEARVIVRVSGSAPAQFAVEYDEVALTLVEIVDESGVSAIFDGGGGRATVQAVAEHDYVLVFTRNSDAETRIDFELMRDGLAVDGGTLSVDPH